MHDIQSVLGHASISKTEGRYAHFSPEHTAKMTLGVLEDGANANRKHRENPVTDIKIVKRVSVWK